MRNEEVSKEGFQKKLIATVVSSRNPPEKEQSRSSGNFSIENVPDKTYALKWVVIGEDSDTTSFDVKQDVFGTDPIIWPGLFNGNLTRLRTARSFYIANPDQAKSESHYHLNSTSDFTVKVYAICPVEDRWGTEPNEEDYEFF